MCVYVCIHIHTTPKRLIQKNIAKVSHTVEAVVLGVYCFFAVADPPRYSRIYSRMYSDRAMI
jgi:hypothetical protein